jgi:hypothetical protein
LGGGALGGFALGGGALGGGALGGFALGGGALGFGALGFLFFLVFLFLFLFIPKILVTPVIPDFAVFVTAFAILLKNPPTAILFISHIFHWRAK